MFLCSRQVDSAEPIKSEDTDVMWNEFLRFRKAIKYSAIYTLLCCCCGKKRGVKEDSELYRQLLLKESREKLEKVLDVRSIMRTNKYLKLLLRSVLSAQSQFMLRNQYSSLLRIKSNAFSSDSERDFTLSEPENDLGENLDILDGFKP